MTRKSILGHKIEFSFYNTKIENSYLFNNEKINELVDKIIERRTKDKLPVTRTKKSYIREIKAHNRLYLFNIYRDRTKDTDLEEHINSFKEIIYFILGV